MRLIYYSLANFPHDSREYQWIQSIRSLRLHNRSIPVWLFLFNGASRELLSETARWDVHVEPLGDYAEFLQESHLRGSILALYPTFHKFLVLANLPQRDLTQVLYLDCDTFFFADVNLLFDRYATHDLYAREEPSSLRSELGYNPKHVDELLLQSIARRERLRAIPPFNSGVCLLNHGIWHSISGLRDTYFDLVWRLLCGQVRRHSDEPRDLAVRQAVADVITDEDRSRALSYPSAKYWIIEQIALWLALGRLPRLSLGTFLQTDVPQGGEFENVLASDQRCILAHYFTGSEDFFFTAVSAISAS
jgi:hypothetical protein